MKPKKIGQCHWCKRHMWLTVDHVLPRSKGGTNRKENRVLACLECNGLKGDMLPDHWRIVRRDVREWWRLARMRGPRGDQLCKAMVECGFSFDLKSPTQPPEEWWRNK